MSLEFVRPRSPTSVAELSPIERRQLVACGRRWDGKAWSAERRLQPTDTPEEGNFYGSGLTRWDCVSGSGLLYDVWLYMVDSGTIFEPGKLRVAAEIVQSEIRCKDPLLAPLLTQAYRAAARSRQ
jgi:hypothetical protein